MLAAQGEAEARLAVVATTSMSALGWALLTARYRCVMIHCPCALSAVMEGWQQATPLNTRHRPQPPCVTP